MTLSTDFPLSRLSPVFFPLSSYSTFCSIAGTFFSISPSYTVYSSLGVGGGIHHPLLILTPHYIVIVSVPVCLLPVWVLPRARTSLIPLHAQLLAQSQYSVNFNDGAMRQYLSVP